MSQRRVDRRAVAAEAGDSTVEYSSDDDDEEVLPDKLDELRKLLILTCLLCWSAWNLPVLQILYQHVQNGTVSIL